MGDVVVLIRNYKIVVPIYFHCSAFISYYLLCTVFYILYCLFICYRLRCAGFLARIGWADRKGKRTDWLIGQEVVALNCG